MSAETIAELRALLEKATPGPWCWAGNIDTGEPYLASRAPGMGASVLAIGWQPRSTTGRAADDVRSYARESCEDPDEMVDMWANDQYGEHIKEPRLWFYTDHMAVEARDLVTFEVAPQATTRDDPKVYRADITGIRHPDAQLITAAVNALPALLALTPTTAPHAWAIEVLYNAGSMSEHWKIYRDEFEQSDDRGDADRERALLIEDGFPPEHVRVVGLVVA